MGLSNVFRKVSAIPPKLKPVNSQNGPVKQKKKCLCQMLYIVLFWSRIFGLTPISWSHPRGRDFIREDGQCQFHISKFWMTYSVVLAVIYNSLFYQTQEDTAEADDVFELLFALNECIYMVFSTLLTIFAILRSWHLVETLNSIAPFLQRGLMCQSSKMALMRTSRVGIGMIFFQMLLQFGALLFMSWNDDFVNHHELKDIMGRLVHNIPFMFYYLFCTISAMYVSLFMCFETAMLQALTNGMLRPDAFSQGASLKIGRCTGSHMNTLKADMETDLLREELDSFRRFHEKLRLSVNSANQALNPQITIHLFIELGVVIMHLFSIVLYFNQETDPVKEGEYTGIYSTSDVYAIFLLDIMFISLHSAGLLLFLFAATGLKMSVIITLRQTAKSLGMIKYLRFIFQQAGPQQQLSDYSSKHLGPEEYAEMRLFGLKLEHIPVQFMAGRFFVIDVTLLAPVSLSIAIPIQKLG